MRAKKYFSAESFLLALGFKVRTLPNTLESFSWSFWASAPSQYLQIREPPGFNIFSARSSRQKHIVISLSWSISLKPLALGAMSLRRTWACPLGSSSSILACVVGSVTSWLDRKLAPSRGGMLRRSMPITVPNGDSGSRMNIAKNNSYRIGNDIATCLHFLRLSNTSWLQPTLIACFVLAVTPASAVSHKTHPPQLSSPSGRPPDSRLQEQLRSPPHYNQAGKGETCHRSPAVWRHSCTGSSGCEKLWRTGLWAAVRSSAARRVFSP